MSENDAEMARLAREIADAYSKDARERSSETQKAVAVLKTELCAARRRELEKPSE